MSSVALNERHSLPLQYLNRHVLITGQTGTGKTSTLMTLTEQLTAASVPVFMVDAKGDLLRLRNTIDETKWLQPDDIGASVQTLGADLLCRALELSQAQSGAVEMAFEYVRQKPRAFQTLEDLHGVLAAMQSDPNSHGFVTSVSRGVIYRAAIRLKRSFVGQPTFDISRLLEPSRLSLLNAEDILRTPRAYSALMLFLLDQLYARLPEVGDLPKPRLVFVIDEAHLIFRELPDRMLTQLEQTVRLIRSKGVALVFASQSPLDIPAIIRDQCAHRIEHSRAHGVGRASVDTMTPDGRPRHIGVIQIAQPECQKSTYRARAAIEAPSQAVPFPSPLQGNVARSNGKLESVCGGILAGGLALLVLWGLNKVTLDLAPLTFWLALLGIGLAAIGRFAKS